MKRVLLVFSLFALNMFGAEYDWVESDKFSALKEELLVKDSALFERLCWNEEIQPMFCLVISFYGIPNYLNTQITHSIKAYNDELNSSLRNTQKNKLR